LALFIGAWCSKGGRTGAAADEQEEKPDFRRASGGDEAAKADGVNRRGLTRATPSSGTKSISRANNDPLAAPFYFVCVQKDIRTPTGSTTFLTHLADKGSTVPTRYRGRNYSAENSTRLRVRSRVEGLSYKVPWNSSFQNGDSCIPCTVFRPYRTSDPCGTSNQCGTSILSP